MRCYGNRYEVTFLSIVPFFCLHMLLRLLFLILYAYQANVWMKMLTCGSQMNMWFGNQGEVVGQVVDVVSTKRAQEGAA